MESLKTPSYENVIFYLVHLVFFFYIYYKTYHEQNASVPKTASPSQLGKEQYLEEVRSADVNFLFYLFIYFFAF